MLKGSERDDSHVAQAGFSIPVYGSEQTTILYAGDRWADYVGNERRSGAPENNRVLNPTFEAGRISVTTPVGWSASSGSGCRPDRGWARSA